jgi:hypothetical protein
MEHIIAHVSISSSNVVSVTPDPIPCQRGHHEIDIEWRLDTNGWKFTAHGIEHKDNTDNTFHDHQPGDRSFHWMNANHHPKRYRYTINVISTDGKTRLTLDPAIQNHGDSVDE